MPNVNAPILPCPVTDNEQHLTTFGTEVWTTRISGAAATFSGIAPDLDFKKILFHWESGAPLFYVSGAISTSTTAIFTANGNTFTLPIVFSSGDTSPFGIAWPSGSSGYISVVAWR